MEFQADAFIYQSNEAQCETQNSTNDFSALTQEFFQRILISWHLHVFMYSRRHETLFLKLLKISLVWPPAGRNFFYLI